LHPLENLRDLGRIILFQLGFNHGMNRDVEEGVHTLDIVMQGPTTSLNSQVL
jgi:hypothetical protein